jgi:3',5'-cyclic AMP phosphodiesterase CpdA
MLIVQISDTHIAGWNKKAYGIAPVARNLSDCVEHINQLIPKPDLVLVTGDITNAGLKEEFEQAASLLNKLDAPYYVIPGNHDDRSNLLSVFGGIACPLTGFYKNQGFINYVIDDFDIRLIAMDSTVIDEPGGEICEIRSAWLDKRLEEELEKPTILFMHHPPVKLGVIESNVDGFIGSERLGAIVGKYTNIERILCGHIHLPAFVRWHGTIVSTAPSMGMQLDLDITMEHPSRFHLEPPAYQLHHWTADNNLVSHTVNVKTIEKTYPFEEH